jgi:hypothetical protein
VFFFLKKILQYRLTKNIHSEFFSVCILKKKNFFFFLRLVKSKKVMSGGGMKVPPRCSSEDLGKLKTQ